MNLNKKLCLLILSFCLSSTAFAQIVVARLMTKTQLLNSTGTAQTWQNISSTGFGSFLNFGFAVHQTDAITVEGGFYYFPYDGSSIYSAPCLISYRHLLTSSDDNDGSGWYLEPAAGYTFGDTDIQESNALGNPLYKPNGDLLNQKVTGPAAALSFGYLFKPSGWIRFNIGLRYEHTFVNGDPATNVIALRISHSFSFGRRDN